MYGKFALLRTLTGTKLLLSTETSKEYITSELEVVKSTMGFNVWLSTETVTLGTIATALFAKQPD
ncbi:MAG: hypothetical protein EBV44_10855 [Synechococcaceae bacterium WB7_1B_046]|nr:hypothetical protein [Synechococcaceae bacterium WB7_1B_046]